jgi:hypothetical protein
MQATAVETHPVDAALSLVCLRGFAAFTGTRATFPAAGFTEVGRIYPSRPVMRMLL